MTIRFRRMIPLLGVAVLCAMMGSAPVRAAAEDPNHISIKDFMFVPMSTKVQVGSTVVWENKDDEPHTVTSDTGLFRSNALDTNEKFSFKFDKAGTYHITCSIHPRMVATIVVE